MDGLVDSNALFYTLSTIAQTLAGALAILVAAVLFKLSSLAKEQELAADTLRSENIDPDVYLLMARQQGFDAMAQEVASRTAWNITGNQRLRRACNAATIAYQAWGRIKLLLYTAVAATVVDIGACMVLLPCTKTILESGWAVLAIQGTVGLSLVCLLLYVCLIVTMVRRPPGVGQ